MILLSSFIIVHRGGAKKNKQDYDTSSEPKHPDVISTPPSRFFNVFHNLLKIIKEPKTR
jgi:hypothetical protein